MDFDVMYKDGRGLQSAVNALIDMLLLAKCDTVLMTRDSAFLAQVPYVFEKPNAIFLMPIKHLLYPIANFFRTKRVVTVIFWSVSQVDIIGFSIFLTTRVRMNFST